MRRSWFWFWTCPAWLECPEWQGTGKSSTSWRRLWPEQSDAASLLASNKWLELAAVRVSLRYPFSLGVRPEKGYDPFFFPDGLRATMAMASRTKH